MDLLFTLIIIGNLKFEMIKNYSHNAFIVSYLLWIRLKNLYGHPCNLYIRQMNDPECKMKIIKLCLSSHVFIINKFVLHLYETLK